jgi:hypothetical protein
MHMCFNDLPVIYRDEILFDSALLFVLFQGELN